MLNCSDSDLRSKICTVVKVTIEAHGPGLYFIYMYFSNIYSFITSPLLPAFYIHFLKMNLNLVFVSFIFCFWITLICIFKFFVHNNHLFYGTCSYYPLIKLYVNNWDCRFWNPNQSTSSICLSTQIYYICKCGAVIVCCILIC